ncbi:MAG: hypothetical protein GY705_28260 [Bacteroidetes bacterium]|nr:hypothetical protein [Bacteroidota bacterium]
MMKSSVIKSMLLLLKPILYYMGMFQHKFEGKLIDRSDIYKQIMLDGFSISSAEGVSQGVQLVKEKLNRLGGRFDTLPDSWWRMFVNIGDTKQISKESFDQLVQYTEDLDAVLLSVADWMELYAIPSRFGLFRLSLVFRNKAVQKVLLDIQSSHKYMKFKFGAVIENRDWETANEIIQHKKMFKMDPKKFYFADWLISILSKNQEGYSIEELTRFGIINKAYSKLIQNKSVAIVGPIMSNENLGAEIDSFDVVIKFNHRTNAQGCDPQTQGERIDVSYYNGTQMDIVVEALNGKFPNGLKAACFNTSSIPPSVSGPDIIRSFTNPNPLLFNGNFNALPNVVYDLLLHNPGHIKIFSSDLMLSRNRYKSYRPARIGAINYTRSCVTHDPITQYSMLRNAWLSKLIMGDKKFEWVMGLGEENYMRELQKVWFGNRF